MLIRNPPPNTTPIIRFTSLTDNVICLLTRFIISSLWAFDFKYYEYLDKLVDVQPSTTPSLCMPYWQKLILDHLPYNFHQ